jgi:hypothetical protein
METRGRGLLVRLDSKGATTYTCEALSQPVCWVNEMGRAEPAVRRDLMALLHGRMR